MNKELKILPSGDYQLPNGNIIKADEIGKMYEKGHKEKELDDDGLRLEEGQCSKPIQLND